MTSEEQLEELKAKISQEVAESFGVFEEIFSALDDITPDQIEELENKFADYVRGYVGDDVLEFMRDIEVPEMSGLCDSE